LKLLSCLVVFTGFYYSFKSFNFFLNYPILLSSSTECFSSKLCYFSMLDSNYFCCCNLLFSLITLSLSKDLSFSFISMSLFNLSFNCSKSYTFLLKSSCFLRFYSAFYEWRVFSYSTVFLNVSNYSFNCLSSFSKA